MSLKTLLLLGTGLVLSGSWAQAEETDRRFYLLGGLDAGYGWLSPSTSSATEASKHGFHGGLKLLGSMELPRWNVDLGAGWLISNLSGSNSGVSGKNVTINTRAGFAELSPRYRINERFELGPVVDFAFGTDLSFIQNLASQNQRSAWLGGAQALYSFPSEYEKVRAGLRYLTDLNISGRSVNSIQLTFQFGLPIGYHGTASEHESTTRSSPTNSENQCIIVEKPNELTVALGVEMLHFETGSSELSKDSVAVAHELGSFLAANSDIWEKLQIDGHTDQRGSFEFNLKLSMNRAQAVKTQLLAAGINPGDRLIPRGFSMAQPIDPESNPKAWAVNRRVELHFTGVKDAAKIRDELKKLEQLSEGQKQ